MSQSPSGAVTGSSRTVTGCWLTILCFALLGVCVLAVVWPYETGSFDVDPQELLAAHLTTDVPDTVALRSELIAYIAASHRANQRQLTRMSNAFRIGACLLAIQIVLTLVAATVIV